MLTKHALADPHPKHFPGSTTRIPTPAQTLSYLQNTVSRQETCVSSTYKTQEPRFSHEDKTSTFYTPNKSRRQKQCKMATSTKQSKRTVQTSNGPFLRICGGTTTTEHKPSMQATSAKHAYIYSGYQPTEHQEVGDIGFRRE